MKRLSLLLAVLLVFCSCCNALAAVTPPGTLPIVDEPIELTIMVASNFTNYDLNPEVNEGMRWLEEVTGVKLNLQVVSGDNAATSVMLSLSQKKLPDAYWGCTWSSADLQKYGMEEDAFIPLNDLIDEYGYYMKEVFAEYPGLYEGMKYPDGNIYGIPDVQICYHCSVPAKMWVNKSWMEKLNIQEPQTIDEFYQMLVAFRDLDPNGNGLKDEIPMSGAISGSNAKPFRWLMQAFVPYYEEYKFMYLDAGQILSSVTTEGYREGLRFMKKLYDEGLLDPASLTQSKQDLTTLTCGEEAIVGCTGALHPQVFIDPSMYERYSSYTTISPVEGPSGRRAAMWIDRSVSTGAKFVITESCEHPEILMRLVDFMFSKEYTMSNSMGLEGVAWKKLPEDTTLTTYDGSKAWCEMLPEATYAEGAGAGIVTDRTNLRPSGMVADYWYGWKAIDKDTLDVYESANIDYLLYDETLKYIGYADKDALIPQVLYYTSEEQEELNQLSLIATNYITGCQVGFIKGEMDLDTDWDDYLNTLNAGGYSRCIELVQNAYDALYKK